MKEESLVEEERSSLSRSAGLFSFATAISRITGAVNIFFIAYALGLTRLQDSYNLANVMPNMLFELIAGGILTSALIPIYISSRLKNEEEGWRVISNITNITVSVLIILALVGTIYAYYFVRVQTFLVPTSKISVTTVTFFFKIFVWEIVFYGLTAIFNAVLQAHRRFTVTALAPIFNNLFVIATILFFYLPLKDSRPTLALTGLAVGTALGIAAMALVQLPSLIKIGWRYHPIINLRDPAFKHLSVLALPVIIYVASNQIGLTVSNALAWKFNGGMSAFTIGWRFFQMPNGLLAVSISTVLFPLFAEKAALKDMDGFKKTLTLGVNTTAFIIIPASVVLFFLSEPLIGLIFKGIMGKFTTSEILQVAGVTAYFMAGLLPFSIFMLLNRAFYSLHDTQTPMIVNAVGIPLNIGLDFLLVGFFGVAGLAMGHSLTYLFTMSLLFLALRRKIGALNGRAMVKSAVKFSLISGTMAVIIVLLAHWVGAWGLAYVGTEAAVILVTTMASGAFYILINALLHTEEVGFLSTMFRGILKREGNGE